MRQEDRDRLLIAIGHMLLADTEMLKARAESLLLDALEQAKKSNERRTNGIESTKVDE